jgi:predicted DNA-binding protein (MmcQ/YjbR family)
VSSSLREVAEALKAEALSFPGAWEDHPWGDTVVKVGKKVFVFLGRPDEEGYGLSVKLPESADEALTLPGAEPTGYGLGRAGWVTLQFSEGDDVPVDLCRDWIDESYRAVATKTMIKQLDAQRAEESP